MNVPVWVNGRLTDPAQAAVSVFDHGLMVGDGVFETVKCVGGAPFALTRHLERLRLSARRMEMPEPDTDAIAEGVRACLAQAPSWALGRIRITHTSGPGPLGSDRGDQGPTTVIVVAEQRPFPATADVAVVPWPRNEHGALAGVKSTSYGENAKALFYAKARGGGEAIFGNTAGNLCEGTGSNVFIVREGRLITPTLAAGCLAGVTRALTLEWCGGVEEDVPLAALREADEAFLTSTTRDVQPIRTVDGAVLPAAPGPITVKAMRIFAERAADDLDP
ncbi:aminotransferase class IV [Planomonospora sp. ID91781]|uniref:Class IV aminotransferase n=3 Tax=Planomonospora TaxID=1998 RepID=A0A171BX75_9ACTN|nr:MULTISPECIES: aminotransferase class IV [Planomonospora]MBG0824058.1 aminotransferase class IV [Planomonospora sp. ID91781]GAT65722.1 class IV aminotransferase [Planomonospora sphaerica]GGK91219.1 4-amino-4-deoxychorismate lyase [Planomonospora parontospora]GII11143.1 4-amino-4-deoxychorismate lyase [Planomonospora parontospora subsp. parontospora]